MSTPIARRLIPAAALMALGVVTLGIGTAACSDNDTTTATSRPPTSVSTEAPPPPVDTGDIPPAPVDTGDIPSAPTDTGDIPYVPPDTGDIPAVGAPVFVTVTVGVDSSPQRIEQVPLGSSVVLAVNNPNSADEFHLHGYDLGDGQVMDAGQTATFSFIADQAGSFVLESHETDAPLLTLEVS
jgi:hypothetical protein